MSKASAPFLSAAALCIPLFLVEVNSSSVQAQEVIRLDLQTRASSEHPTTYVDSNDVIVLDVSSSMDDQELIAAFKGAASYYTSERNIANYKLGICASSTVVFFGKGAYVGKGAIICSEADAKQFAQDMLSEDLNTIRLLTGIDATNTDEGLYAAYYLLKKQKENENIESVQYRIVVVGDELQNYAQENVKNAVVALTQDFSAQIFGVAIGSMEVQDRFTYYVATDKTNFPAALAQNPDQVSKSLNEFLRYTNG